jgi:hypothetical protein
MRWDKLITDTRDDPVPSLIVAQPNAPLDSYYSPVPQCILFYGLLRH